MLGELACLGAAVERARRADIAVEAALVDALRDRREAEEREHEIEGPIRDLATSGAAAISRDVMRFARAAPARIKAREVPAACIRDMPGQAIVGEIGERVAERRELPINNGKDARLRRVPDHVLEAVIAMDDRRLVLRGDVRGKPA